MLFLVVTSTFSITLCYSNPSNQLILFSLLTFFVIATVQPKEIIYNVSMWIFIVFVALSIHFRSFVTNGAYTTSLYFVNDMNKRRRSRGETIELSAISLWHTAFTGIYRVAKIQKKEQR